MIQLVLQFKPWGDRPFDDLLDLESRLVTALQGTGDVDGHDVGSDEANIFIITTQLAPTLTACMGVLQLSGLRSICSAAYRDVAEDRYTRVWPVGDRSPFHIA
jgi:hypothetical protein